MAMNSTFVEYVDRHFLQRGWAAMGATPFVAMGLAFSGHIASTMHSLQEDGTARDAAFITTDWIFITAWLLFTLCVIKFIWLKDFFCYTHYPIRFNRKNRMVYVFRHNGPGGVLTVPWTRPTSTSAVRVRLLGARATTPSTCVATSWTISAWCAIPSLSAWMAAPAAGRYWNIGRWCAATWRKGRRACRSHPWRSPFRQKQRCATW
ncbi:hypothetical protein CBM2587_B60316 [Cupriavidus taiwanensis]|uniref:DUF6708 domain-containing protein n=1 Tax=Cupriavidus taiwanensis TaxID=164546 RepID=A0A975X9Y0_9BURK|nr:hypothetical protein CBM2587_B60316 [Cupriavidus taiwanensis]